MKGKTKMDEKIFEGRMTIMFSNFMENINWQIKYAHRTPRINTERITPRHFVVKLINDKDKERTWRKIRYSHQKQWKTKRGE